MSKPWLELRSFIREGSCGLALYYDVDDRQVVKVVADDPRSYLLDIDLGDRGKNYKGWAYSSGNGHVSSKGFVALTRKLFDHPPRDATIELFDTYGAARAEERADLAEKKYMSMCPGN